MYILSLSSLICKSTKNKRNIDAFLTIIWFIVLTIVNCNLQSFSILSLFFPSLKVLVILLAIIIMFLLSWFLNYPATGGRWNVTVMVLNWKTINLLSWNVSCRTSDKEHIIENYSNPEKRFSNDSQPFSGWLILKQKA